MYCIGHCFIDDIGTDSKIWRYINFPKYVNMLLKKSLFFSRFSILEDKYEATIPNYDLEQREQQHEQFESMWKDDWKLIVGDVCEEWSENMAKLRENSVVNCWRMDEDESQEAWKKYTDERHGIVIQSTIKKLAESFQDGCIFIKPVKYSDTTKKGVGNDWKFNEHLRVKGLSYEWEQEIRALIPSNLSSSPDGKPDLNLDPEKKGEYIPVDLNILVEKVYVDPLSEDWFLDTMKSITNSYLLDKEVERSKLDAVQS